MPILDAIKGSITMSRVLIIGAGVVAGVVVLKPKRFMMGGIVAGVLPETPFLRIGLANFVFELACVIALVFMMYERPGIGHIVIVDLLFWYAASI